MPTPPNSNKPAYWFIFQNEQLLIGKDGETIQILTTTAIKQIPHKHHLLAEFDDFTVYCAELQNEQSIDGTERIPLRKALEVLGEDWYSLAAKAYAIINWDKNHQFCGRCGSSTILKTGTFERICTLCSLTFYPRISPSMIVLIHKNDDILMARSPHFMPGAFGLIAGFVEPGESVEDAVHREVKEEVGIKVKNLRYFGSQAWPFPDSLMIGFIAEYASGELVVNHNEIEQADWYHFDKLPGRPSTKISIASKLLDHYLAELKKRPIK